MFRGVASYTPVSSRNNNRTDIVAVDSQSWRHSIKLGAKLNQASGNISVLEKSAIFQRTQKSCEQFDHVNNKTFVLFSPEMNCAS